MTGPEALGWCGAVAVLGGYGWSIRARRPKVFHAANVIGSIGTGISAAAAGPDARPNLALTAAFGVLGVVGLLRSSDSAGESGVPDAGE